ncbi:MAG: hypothetical protein N3F05_04480 [Candidatus Diapherotrites archaeon]|nr:hypothetical protein [Candidatus Diapherotrites archaeon]
MLWLTLLNILLFWEIISDFMLVLKIFAIITIISFVLNHVESKPLAAILIVAISWFVVFEWWQFFGGIYLLYTLITLGISGMLVDFFFISGMAGDRTPQQVADDNSPVSSSLDLAQRKERLEAARRIHAMKKRPGGMMR